MDGDEGRGPGEPGPSGRTEQEIFDDQIAQASGKTVVCSVAWASWPLS